MIPEGDWFASSEDTWILDSRSCCSFVLQRGLTTCPPPSNVAPRSLSQGTLCKPRFLGLPSGAALPPSSPLSGGTPGTVLPHPLPAANTLPQDPPNPPPLGLSPLKYPLQRGPPWPPCLRKPAFPSFILPLSTSPLGPSGCLSAGWACVSFY